MLSIESVRNVSNGLQADADAVGALGRGLDDFIQRVKADATRSPEWKSEQIAAARKACLEKMAEKIKTFPERVQALEAQRQYWSNVAFLLSRQKFDASETNDSIVKMRQLRECEAMPPALLQLTADSAKEDKNLPLLWQCHLAGHALRGGAGWKGIHLDDVKVPNQDEALRLIALASAVEYAARSAYGVASGGILTGADKLNLARVQQVRANQVQTRHNSPGRVTPKAP